MESFSAIGDEFRDLHHRVRKELIEDKRNPRKFTIVAGNREGKDRNNEAKLLGTKMINTYDFCLIVLMHGEFVPLNNE